MNIVKRILQANQGRDPELLQMKYSKMRADPFTFMRGTCHLFYDRLPKQGLFKSAPLVWSCGDLHLENFGSYQGDNHLVYFDINDFDEAALAPLTWELARVLASLYVGAKTFDIDEKEAKQLMQCFIRTYTATLSLGKARWIERETAEGVVAELLQGLHKRSRKEFLDSRTLLKESEQKHPKRRIKIDGKKALAVSSKQEKKVRALMKKFAASQADPDYFEVLDVARRIAGTGSLGLERYIILVEGKGSPDQNTLLDLKVAQPSSIAKHLSKIQPSWQHQAQRIVSVQTRMQAVSMAFLTTLEHDHQAFVLKALHPSEDRIPLSDIHKQNKALKQMVTDMAQIVAWDALRSVGRQGSANSDALMAYGQRQKWQSQLLEYSIQLGNSVINDWHSYCKAYDQQVFAIKNA